jgi:hypothetical protein
LIRIFLGQVSDALDLDTAGTPQNLALEWITNLDTLSLCPQQRDALIQRYAMAVFYYSTDGDRWLRCSAPSDHSDPIAIAIANAQCGGNAWLTPVHECSWRFLECDNNDNMIRINIGKSVIHYYLRSIKNRSLYSSWQRTLTIIVYQLFPERNRVGGTLPYEMSELQSLQLLSLEEGLLAGTIPSQLGDIQTLEEIDLNFNIIGGSIPETFFTLSNLKQLDLNDNELTGTISTRIGDLSMLTFFQIERNLFTGTIPRELGQLQLLGTILCQGSSQ